MKQSKEQVGSRNLSQKSKPKKLKDPNKKKKKSIRKVQSTQQNLPIKDIVGGVVVTKDNRYVKIMEVKPVNFNLKSQQRQEEITSFFYKMLKNAPGNIMFSSLTLPSNLKPQISSLQHDIDTESNEKCQEMGYEYMQKLKEVEEYGLSRRYFISFTPDVTKKTNIFSGVNYGQIVNDLNSTADRIAGELNSCGNKVIDTDINNPNLQPAEILYTYLNRNSAKNFDEVLQDVFNRYYTTMRQKDFYVPPNDYIAPQKISYMNSKYVVVNDTYYLFAYVKKAGYPDTFYPGWASVFVNSYDGVDFNVYFRKQDGRSALTDVRKNIARSGANTTGNTNSQGFDDSVKKLGSSEYIKQGLQMREDLYYMSVMITITGNSPEEVDAKFDAVKQDAQREDFKLQVVKLKNEKALLSSLPLGKIDDSLYKRTQRNILTEGVATAYPFVSYEVNDTNGILFGDAKGSNAATIVDIFKFQNANMFVAGQTGAGKSFTLMLMALRMRIKHIPVFIIAPEKQHEFKRVSDAIGGVFVPIAAGSEYRINPLEIRKKDDKAVREQALIDGDEIQFSLLSDKVTFVKKFIKLLLKGQLAMELEAPLDEAIVRTYAKFGITDDNESLYDPTDLEHKKYRKMPILSDLQEELKSDPQTRGLASCLSILTTGSGKSFNGQTNVDLDNEFIVIGLEKLDEEMLPLGLYLAMDFIWGKIKEDRTKHKLLFIDEFWRMAFNKIAADYCIEIMKLIRAYGGGFVALTQQISDLFGINGGQFGDNILNNCKTKILMQMEEKDSDTVQKYMPSLTSAEKSALRSFEKGDGLLVAGDNNIILHFNANQTEKELISTDVKTLNEIKERKLAELKEKQRQEAMKNAPDITHVIKKIDYFSKEYTPVKTGITETKTFETTTDELIKEVAKMKEEIIKADVPEKKENSVVFGEYHIKRTEKPDNKPIYTKTE